jgi:glycerol kinase
MTQSEISGSPKGNVQSAASATQATHIEERDSEAGAKLNDNERQKVFIGSIDAGTTSSRFIIFDGTGNPVAQHQIEFGQFYEHSGWHEHDPQELINSVRECIDKATQEFVKAGHEVSDISCVGITNQRETTLVWDSETGETLYNAIAWPDTRTKSLVRELKSRQGADGLQEICGLPLSTYPSSVKLLWLLKNVDAVRKAYDDGKLVFGTVDTWLLWNLNGAKGNDFHVTDATNASRTMFMNLHTLQYDEKLLDFFQLDMSKVRLPKIVPSSSPEAFGTISSGPLKGTRITGCLGDQSAALVGQQGFTPGSAKNTYGTGCFLLYNVGEKPVISYVSLLYLSCFNPHILFSLYSIHISLPGFTTENVFEIADKVVFLSASMAS